MAIRIPAAAGVSSSSTSSPTSGASSQAFRTVSGSSSRGRRWRAASTPRRTTSRRRPCRGSRRRRRRRPRSSRSRAGGPDPRGSSGSWGPEGRRGRSVRRGSGHPCTSRRHRPPRPRSPRRRPPCGVARTDRASPPGPPRTSARPRDRRTSRTSRSRQASPRGCREGPPRSRPSSCGPPGAPLPSPAPSATPRTSPRRPPRSRADRVPHAAAPCPRPSRAQWRQPVGLRARRPGCCRPFALALPLVDCHESRTRRGCALSPYEMGQDVKEAAGMAYREAGDPAAPAVLFVHGYPESSFMWRAALAAVGEAGWRGVAPDLPGYGDSPAGEGPGTWEEHVDSLERFRSALSLDDAVLVTHDWGVLIGLRWACDQAGVARALVISDGGFFADRRWHDMANLMRTPGEGERMMDAMNREAFGAFLGQASAAFDEEALDEYWKGGATRELRQRHLELYRSGDFSKLEPYEGCLAALRLPSLVLWGAQDRFASVRMASRFADELPDSELRVFEDAGHFVWEDEPAGASAALVDFLERRVRDA